MSSTKIIKWLVALAVLSLLVAPTPALPTQSVHIERDCPLMSVGCNSPRAMDCNGMMNCNGMKNRNGKCPNVPYAKGTICQISLFSSTEASDSGYSYFGKGSSSSYDKENPWTSSSRSVNGDAYSNPSQANFDDIGPPDMDVIEYLPPSAKLVFNVLEFDGPMTQKDLISKTGLPTNTVRYALGKLKEECVIKECFYFPDARQSLYGLKTATFKNRQK